MMKRLTFRDILIIIFLVLLLITIKKAIYIKEYEMKVNEKIDAEIEKHDSLGIKLIINR